MSYSITDMFYQINDSHYRPCALAGELEKSESVKNLGMGTSIEGMLWENIYSS